MSRFYGKIGYANTVEIRPGVWEDVITEVAYKGNVVRDVAKWREGSTMHDKLTVANTISIVADAYALNHIHAIRYISWLGSRWSVADAQVLRPRLLLRLGGLYNGPTPELEAETTPGTS